MPTVEVSPSVERYRLHGRLTLGYVVQLDGAPVFAGTWSECVDYGCQRLGVGPCWVIRDARGLEVL